MRSKPRLFPKYPVILGKVFCVSMLLGTNTKKMEEHSDQTFYEKDVQSRGKWRYYKGLLARWKQHFKYVRAVRIARRRGATIGEGVIMPLALAKRANKNLTIGNHVSIQTTEIDMRCLVSIGNNVIIGSGVRIITLSHNIDSPEWEHKAYGIEIADDVWIATDALVLPSCRKIARGTVVGAGSVLVGNTEEMDVVGGNPAEVLRKRKCVHRNLVVESLLGGDYYIYKQARAKK